VSGRSRWVRNVRKPWLVALVAMALALGGSLVLARHRERPRTVAVVAGLRGRVVFAAFAGAAHPHGPDETPTRSRTPWSGPGAVPMWHGGGRHPVWRGCQRVYDPALSKFIFSRPSPSS
jgi:hypothetical protein